MKYKITYTNGAPWESKDIYKELTTIVEGETKDKAKRNFYVSPEGKRAKTLLKSELLPNQ